MAESPVLRRVKRLEARLPGTVVLNGHAAGNGAFDDAGHMSISVSNSYAERAGSAASADFAAHSGPDGVFPTGTKVGVSNPGQNAHSVAMPYNGILRLDVAGPAGRTLHLRSYSGANEILSSADSSTAAVYCTSVAVRKGQTIQWSMTDNVPVTSVSISLCRVD